MPWRRITREGGAQRRNEDKVTQTREAPGRDHTGAWMIHWQPQALDSGSSCQVWGAGVLWGHLARGSRNLRLSWISATIFPGEEEDHLLWNDNGSLQRRNLLSLLMVQSEALCPPLHKKTMHCMTYKQHTLISHRSRGWEVQVQGAGRF